MSRWGLLALSETKEGSARPPLNTQVALLVIAFVALRKLLHLQGTFNFTIAGLLLAAFTLLYFYQGGRRRRWPYFLIQMGLIQALGLLEPYEDTWGLLYVLLGARLGDLPPSRAVAAWGAVFTLTLLVTMIATLGLLEGVGFSLLNIAVAAFFYSGSLHFAQADAARQDSQKLLDELQKAHQRLRAYAAQAEELAAAQERDRITHELHDSVSQMVFSISLNIEAARLRMAKDPTSISEDLERLQDLTGRALAQMRALITQWRPI